MIKNIKLFIIYAFLKIGLFVFKINLKEFTYKSTGTLERNEVITFPGGGKFISFKHSGGFETNIDKYGKYQCKGSILYDNNSSLENMYFACEFKDQNGDVFIGMGKRLKGSDMDRAVGKSELIDGKGFWKDYIGYNVLMRSMLNDIVFAPGQV